MSIEESINQIIDSLMGQKANLLNHSDRIALTDALNTMNKYQKIVQIMERTVDDGTSMYDTLQEIEEVIEDGKID